jgi:hypothetical protein
VWSLGRTAAAKGAKGKGAKAAKAAKPAKKPKVTKGKAGAKKDDAGQSADGIKKERDEDGERERDEVRHCIFALIPLFYGVPSYIHLGLTLRTHRRKTESKTSTRPI